MNIYILEQRVLLRGEKHIFGNIQCFHIRVVGPRARNRWLWALFLFHYADGTEIYLRHLLLFYIDHAHDFSI